MILGFNNYYELRTINYYLLQVLSLFLMLNNINLMKQYYEKLTKQLLCCQQAIYQI